MKPGKELGGAGNSWGSREESLRGQAFLEEAGKGARGGRWLWGEPGRELGGVSSSEGSQGESSEGQVALEETEKRAVVDVLLV